MNHDGWARLLLCGLLASATGCGDDGGDDAPDAARPAIDAAGGSGDAVPPVADAAPSNPDAAPSDPDAAPSDPDAAPPAFRSPVAYWSMDATDITDTALADLVGDVDGVITGATTDAAGQVGDALVFDGVDDFVDFGDTLDSVFAGADRAFSVAVWLRLPAPSATRVVFGKTSDSACNPDEDGRQWMLALSAANVPTFSFQPTAVGGAQLVSATTAVDAAGAWHHVIAVYDGAVDSSGKDRVAIYVDGAVETTSHIDLGGFPFDLEDSPARLAAGVRVDSAGATCTESGAGHLAGALDELAVWDVALTVDEAAAIHARGAAGIRLAL